MKVFRLILITAFLCSSLTAATAMAADNSEVVNHPIVAALVKMVNEKNGGTCELPSQTSGVRWFCTGGLSPITKPTLERTGCFFDVEVKCAEEVATISGRKLTYLLLMPNHQDTQSSDPVIVLDKVTYRTP